MEDVRSVQLPDEERIEFLERGGTGVISFPGDGDDPPYSLPVSYGYDPDSGDFYFRLAFGPDVGKAEVAGDSVPVSFVTYGEGDAGWRSVVVTGVLEEVRESDLDSTALEGMRGIQIPLVDVFDRDPREVTFRFFRLDPDDVTGRKEARGG